MNAFERIAEAFGVGHGNDDEAVPDRFLPCSRERPEQLLAVA